MQATRAHGLDLCGVRLYGKKLDFLASNFRQMVQELGPNRNINGRILDRRVCEDQRVGINQHAGVSRNVGDQVAVNIAITFVKRATRAVLRGGIDRPGKSLLPRKSLIMQFVSFAFSL